MVRVALAAVLSRQPQRQEQPQRQQPQVTRLTTRCRAAAWAVAARNMGAAALVSSCNVQALQSSAALLDPY
jgi:hypothetical protein